MDGRIEWRGALACADCDGIAMQLVLRRDAAQHQYTLTEFFADAGGGMQFVEQGRWHQDAALLRLEGDSGARRVFALLPDGRLQPRDGRGHAYPGRRGDVLMPVTAGRGP